MIGISRKTWLLLALLFIAAGCPPETPPTESVAPTVQIIRVRLLSGVNQVSISATANPILSITGDPQRRELLFPKDQAVWAARNAGGWWIGGQQFAGSVLTLTPAPGSVLSVNQAAYRGSLRLVPAGDGFDVVDDVQIDDYLQGVLAQELYRDWQPETYKAQAVAARTYAMYIARTEGVSRYWDVYPDERSQVYGGVAAETDKSRLAVAQTAGLVLTYGPGEGKIFPAYFSSDCGGITQSATDVFGGPSIPPLDAHPNGDCDRISPHRGWGPIAIGKDELTRRLRAWGLRHARPEATMAELNAMAVASVNSFGRTRSFQLTDSDGMIYVMAAEEVRAAVDAGGAPALPSSFCKAGVSPDGQTIVFYDGHGSGHGVGLCQWCAQEWALEGRGFEEILAASYPQSKLARAY
jgi:stage II sporulation protein D